MKKKTIANQSFANGAIILTISMAIGKILGALFKIPLARLIGPVGMGYYGAAYELYSPLYALATAGFPIAISKIVSENMAKKIYRDVRKTHKASIPLFLLTGTIGFLIMVLVIPFYTSNVVKAPDCKYAMYALAPTILFACLVSIYRGYYEGLRDMFPTAISEFIESLVKFILGLSLAYGVVFKGMTEFSKNSTVFGNICKNKEEAMSIIVPFSAAGAILAIPIGTFIAYIYMFIRYKIKGDGITNRDLINSPYPSSYKMIIKQIVRISAPIGLGAVIMNAATFIDVTLVMRRIEYIMNIPYKSQILLNQYQSLIPASIIEKNEVHIYLYGCLGIATTIMMLIPTVTQAFGISALPSVTTAWISRDKKEIKESIESVIKLTTIFTIPAGLGMIALAYPIMNLAYGGNEAQEGVNIAANVLTLLGIGGIFAAMSTPICSMLQAIGRIDLPVKLLSIGVIMKIGFNYILVGIPEINIQGAGAGTIFCYSFVTITAMYLLSKQTKISFNLATIILKPLIASIICASTAYFSNRFISEFFPLRLSTIFAIIISALVYIIFIFLLRTLNESEIRMLPKGNKIIKVLAKFKIIR